MASEFAENTILIITADHSMYPTQESNKLYGMDAKHFVGKIPFCIYHKNFKPTVIDAKNRNSLAFAPTVLDLLGIHQEENFFLGHSLFCDVSTKYDNIAIQGKNIFQIKKNGEVELLKKVSRHQYRYWQSWVDEYYGFIW